MEGSIRCCLNCPDRTVSCHSTCERYRKEREAWEKRKEEIKRVKEQKNDTFDRFKYWR